MEMSPTGLTTKGDRHDCTTANTADTARRPFDQHSGRPAHRMGSGIVMRRPYVVAKATRVNENERAS